MCCCRCAVDKHTTDSTPLFNINAVKKVEIVNVKQNIPTYLYNLSQSVMLMGSASLDLQFEYKHDYLGKVLGGGAAVILDLKPDIFTIFIPADIDSGCKRL